MQSLINYIEGNLFLFHAASYALFNSCLDMNTTFSVPIFFVFIFCWNKDISNYSASFLDVHHFHFLFRNSFFLLTNNNIKLFSTFLIQCLLFYLHWEFLNNFFKRLNRFLTTFPHSIFYFANSSLIYFITVFI